MNWNNIELPDKNIYFQDDDVVIYHADCREILPSLKSISAVVTDPPYELGFMGKGWDKQGVSFQLDTWRLIREACLPGAMLLSFGGDRTHHRMMVAIEDAGWQIRTCLYWCFASGFPKSLNIAKKLTAILPASLRCVCADHLRDTASDFPTDYQNDCGLYDEQPLGVKDSDLNNLPLQDDAPEHNRGGQNGDDLVEALIHILGHLENAHLSSEDYRSLCNLLSVEYLIADNAQCDTIRNKLHALLTEKHKTGTDISNNGHLVSDSVSSVSYSNPSIDSITRIYHQCQVCNKYYAGGWQGYGTGLKPAMEIICLAMNPIDGTFASNALKHRVAGLNIDATRIPHNENLEVERDGHKLDTKEQGWGFKAVSRDNKGRFPANFIHDGSQEVMELFPETSRGWGQFKAEDYEDGKGVTGFTRGDFTGRGDSGSAARFFYNTGKAERDLLFNNAKAIIELWNIEIANTVDDNSSLSKEHAASVLSRAVTEASHGAIHLNALMGLSMSVTPRLLRYLCESVTIATLSIEGKSLPVSYLISTVKSRNNLARFAGIPEQIDTTMTTPNPMSSDGYAVVATFNTTQDYSVAGARDLEFSRFKYCAKSSRRERDAGLEDMPEMSKMGFNASPREYDGKVHSEIHLRNSHPTVKPLALMTYLCQLVKMPEYNLILDPFCGSGTTLLACKKLGIKAIGIEASEEYCEIAAKRVSRA